MEEEMIAGMVARYRAQRSLLYENAIYLYLSPLTMGGTGFAFWVLCARWYSAETIGRTGALIQFATFIVTLSLLGISSLLIRYLPEQEDQRPLLTAGTVLVVFLGLVVGGIGMGTLHFWNPDLGGTVQGDIVMNLLLAGLIGGSVLWDMTEAAFIANRVAKYAFVKNTLFVVLRLGLLVGAAAIGFQQGILWAWVLALLVGLLFAYGYQYRRLGLHGQVEWQSKGWRELRRHWRFAASNYVVHTFQHMGELLMPAFVVLMLGAEEGGYFYIAWAVGLLLLKVPDSMAMSLFAEGSNFQETLRENVAQAYKFSMAIGVVGMLVCLMLGRFLLGFFGQEYADHAYSTLVLLSISVVPFTVVVIHKAVLRVREKRLELALMWVFLTAVLFGLSFGYVPKVGIEAVPLSWFLGNLLLAIWIAVFRRGVYRAGAD